MGKAILSYTLDKKSNSDADELMGKFRISGVPITVGRRLVGIITNRDLKFEEDFSKIIKNDVTIVVFLKTDTSKEDFEGNVAVSEKI